MNFEPTVSNKFASIYPVEELTMQERNEHLVKHIRKEISVNFHADGLSSDLNNYI